jgi:hypothetical protein
MCIPNARGKNVASRGNSVGSGRSDNIDRKHNSSGRSDGRDRKHSRDRSVNDRDEHSDVISAKGLVANTSRSLGSLKHQIMSMSSIWCRIRRYAFFTYL